MQRNSCSKTPKAKPKITPRETALISDTGLLQKLKELRRDLASKKGVPAYIIFNDKALFEMAENKPKTQDDFLRINGVGLKNGGVLYTLLSGNKRT